MQNMQGFVGSTAPGSTAPMRRRSWLLVILGAPVALFASLFVLLAIVDLAGQPKNLVGPIGGGSVMLIVLLGALLLVRHGLAKVPAKTGITHQEALALRASFLAHPAVNTSDPRAQRINAAAGLMLAKRYVEAGAAYEQIAQSSPEDRAVALSQVGVARYFLGKYAEAIAYYEQALAAGADPSTMNDNIQEAREALRRAG